MHYNVILRPFLKRCCRGKAIGITYSEYVFVTLVIKQGKNMPTVLLSVACPAVPDFFTLSH